MHFVIAGRLSCKQFSYAVMVAQRLKERLPDFTYLKIAKKDDEWDKWLNRTCLENNWYHIKSPIIWREIGLKQGKKDFIGSINKFLDLCYEYYGIPRDVLSAGSFKENEIEWFTKQTETQFFEDIKAEAKKRKVHRSRQVCITGASTPIAEIVIMEILQTQKQWREDGLEIRLFDDPSKEKKLISSAADAKFCPGPSGLGNCRVTTTLKDSLTNVDLVIVLDCIARKPKETLVKWLKRNRNAMCALGKALNAYAPPHCRVIIGSPSNQPICYNATVLASFATNLHVRNIVAVTQDLGREVLRSISIVRKHNYSFKADIDSVSRLSLKTNVPLRDFYCPPVWGFVGLNKVVDLSNTLQSHLYKVPGKRTKSTLPQGTEEMELRMSSTFTTEDEKKDIQIRSKETKGDISLQLGRWPHLAKATAILDLLNVWGLKQENGNGEIISLGVYSDGTFNIPKGLYWSQPVTLINGFWMPFKDYPIPRSNYINTYYLFPYSIAALYRTKIKPRLWVWDKLTTSKEKTQKEVKKFNLDKLIQETGVPVIRTDKECVDYLKNLAKKELGIDFDAADDRISEESEEEMELIPVEEVTREEVFCECWRQQLKELQKVVFDRSSTTEIEIDLSDVISGSEWSIINPKNEIFSSAVSTAEVRKIEEDESRKPSQEDESSESTVCSCGAVQSGSTCHCLVRTPKEHSEDKISTEHFYAEQNAEVFEVDIKDAIYADSPYLTEKHVSFDAEAKEEDLKGFQVKFYGRKDRIRDKKTDLRMQKRIRRYERGGENSIEEEGEGEIATREESLVSVVTDESQKDGKFHLSVQGASYEIIGDHDALETLEERRRSTGDEMRDSSFREIYKDEIIPSIQILPPDLAMSTATSSGKDLSLSGEGNLTCPSEKDRSLASADAAEVDDEGVSIGSLENDLNEIWGEEGGGLFYVVSEKSDEEAPIPQKKWWQREGVSLCCMCQCIIPEGLPCCPCGATTVVEVFKKESIEIFIRSEDNLTYNVEYLERSITESEASVGNIEMTQEPSPKKNLPPESFFPFSPKSVNKFRPTQRPFELAKEYIESFRKVDLLVPSMCQKLLNEARIKIEEEKENAKRKKEEEGEKEYELPEPCSGEERIKTDFSDLNFFIPCSLEDWRLTVQKKYREWFFEGTQIQDESYYDIAIEEVSEDEFELDKELERFFET